GSHINIHIPQLEVDMSAVTQTDPPAVEMKGFKLTHPEPGARRLPTARIFVRLGGRYGQSKQGSKIRRIAKELGISRNTVREYVRAIQPPSSPDQLEQAVCWLQAKGWFKLTPLSTAGTAKLTPFRPPGKSGEKACVKIT